jgi:cobalt-zinc-cadmium efflux system membrane fusion protein
VAPPAVAASNTDADPTYEVQELRVELGTQVQAGQLLAILSDHRLLYVVGHAFKREAPALERAAQNRWPVRIEFAEDEPAGWPPLPESLAIRHLANTIDPESRTFDFFLPLENQSRRYASQGDSFVVWRFRPGQRVRLHVPVEELSDVIVLPAGAVVRDGPEAYVFRQNGNLFKRLPVHVLHEDRLNVVLANDGSVAPGWYLAHNAAASLNRALEAQSASGTPVGVHVHADGTVHGAH